MSRWIKHWHQLPILNRIGSAVCVVALIACLLALAYQIGAIVADIYRAIPGA